MKLRKNTHLCNRDASAPRHTVSRVLCIAAATASCAAFAPAAAWADDDVTPPGSTVGRLPALDLDVRIDDETRETIERPGRRGDRGRHRRHRWRGRGHEPTRPRRRPSSRPRRPAEAAAEDRPIPHWKAHPRLIPLPIALIPPPVARSAESDDERGRLTATTASATVPAAPTVNVNVSVRIGSAGDNGSVSQTNATGTPAQTTPLASSGASPSDERAGRLTSDARVERPRYFPYVPMVLAVELSGSS